MDDFLVVPDRGFSAAVRGISPMKVLLVVLLLSGCAVGGKGLRVELTRGDTTLKVFSDRHYEGGYDLGYENPTTGEKFYFRPQNVQNSEQQANVNTGKALDLLSERLNQ